MSERNVVVVLLLQDDHALRKDLRQGAFGFVNLVFIMRTAAYI